MKSNFAEPPSAGSAGQPAKKSVIRHFHASIQSDLPVCSRGSQSV